MIGSTTTRSPLLVVLMNNFVLLYCSATRGEILALKPPVLKRGVSFPNAVQRKTDYIPKTLDGDSNNEAGQRSLCVADNTGNRRDDKKDMADERDDDRYTDGLVTTPLCVCNVGTEERNDVNPACP